MKKFLILFLTLALILGVFVSCNSNLPIDDETSSSPSESINTKITESNESNIIENTDTEDKLTEITSETVKPGKPNGLLRQIYTFYSFDEFAFNFSKDANAENSEIQAEKDMYGDKFSKLVNFLNNHNDQILHPLSNGEPMFTASNGQESVLIVELLTEDYYDLPWIWYYLEDKLISVTYPKEVLDVDFDTTPSVEEIYKAMAGDQAIDYNVQNVELDGITVSAIVEGNRSKYSFYYNGIYVSIESNTWRGISDEFLKSFSMGQLNAAAQIVAAR